LDGFKTPWWQYFLPGTPADIKQSGNKHISVTILPGLDHFFEVKAPTGWTPSNILCPTIGFWLRANNI
jgi:hypothetical protein